jgi:hypothetical protein
MPQPTPYDRQASFTLLASQNPSTPYTGADLDAEFNAVKVTLDELLARLPSIQRDDGDLANASVGPDQLAPALTLGFNPPTAWAEATEYSVFDSVFFEGAFYTAAVAHTSAVDFITDFDAGYWNLVASFASVVIEDGSVTTAKLANLAVNSAKLNSSAVTTTKIADASVTANKLAALAVTQAKVASGAVVSDHIQDEAVTNAKLASAALRALGDLTIAANKFAYFTSSTAAALADISALGRSILAETAASGVKTLLAVAFADLLSVPTTLSGYGITDAEALGTTRGSNFQTVTNYTAVLTDAGKLVAKNVATANTFTIPPNSSVAFPVGTYLHVGQWNVGQTTIAAGSGVTIVAADGLKIAVRYGIATLLQVQPNVWWAEGRIEA